MYVKNAPRTPLYKAFLLTTYKIVSPIDVACCAYSVPSPYRSLSRQHRVYNNQAVSPLTGSAIQSEYNPAIHYFATLPYNPPVIDQSVINHSSPHDKRTDAHYHANPKVWPHYKAIQVAHLTVRSSTRNSSAAIRWKLT